MTADRRALVSGRGPWRPRTGSGTSFPSRGAVVRPVVSDSPADPSARYRDTDVNGPTSRAQWPTSRTWTAIHWTFREAELAGRESARRNGTPAISRAFALARRTIPTDGETLDRAVVGTGSRGPPRTRRRPGCTPRRQRADQGTNGNRTGASRRSSGSTSSRYPRCHWST